MEMHILAIDSSGISKGDSEEGWSTTATSASSKMVLSNKTSGWTVMYFSRAGARYREKISSEGLEFTVAAAIPQADGSMNFFEFLCDLCGIDDGVFLDW